MQKNTLLIIDDSSEFTEDLKLMLADEFDVFTASNAADGLDIIRKNFISVLLLDLQLPDIHGLELLERLHGEIDPYLPVIVVTEFDEIDYVVKAMRLGAYDFLSKDFHIDLMKEKINKALSQKKLRIRVTGLQNNNSVRDDAFIFVSEKMKKINFEITRLANLNLDVLLSGETGAGKDMAASQIFLRSKRADKPFISVPIRTLSETLLESELFGHEKGAFTGAEKMKLGKFESANQGFVYIPEISNLQDSVQLKLLHFMQYKSITRVGQDMRKGEISLDVRVIMATNENLDELVSSGRIREDFFYRISGIRLEIPPLRERKEDIIPLAEYFIEKYTGQLGNFKFYISDKLKTALLDYEWKGNVRELSNAVKNAITYASGPELSVGDFPCIYGRAGKTPGANTNISTDFLREYKVYERSFKKQYFESLLQHCDGRISDACKIAGLTPQGFRKILKQLGINY